MNNRQREALEREVAEHQRKIELLSESVRDLEENLQNVENPPRELLARLADFKLELRGRMAALAIGGSCLDVDARIGT